MSHYQRDRIIDYLEKNTELARNLYVLFQFKDKLAYWKSKIFSLCSEFNSNPKWIQLADMLNDLDGGKKNHLRWRKAWEDLRFVIQNSLRLIEDNNNT